MKKNLPKMKYLTSKIVKQNKGITLISLIITIIILIILTVVTIKIVINDGIIANARKATFYAEMQAINEKKDLSKFSNFLNQGDNNSVESSFLDQKITVETLNKFSDTLKAEIAFARSGFGGGMQLKTKKIWKDNMYDCRNLYEEAFIAGVADDIYYISKEVSGAEQKYIYDSVTDICFKIEDTKIASHVVHSLEYAKLILDGVNSNGIGVVDTETKVMTSSDGTKCYEPDLNNFSYKTEIIYYSSDFNTKQTKTIKEFIEEGKLSSIEVSGTKYTFADYTSTGTKVWANVRTTANGLESYWVWIPRFAYSLDADNKKSNIIFVDVNNKQMDGSDLPQGYVLHEAFAQKDGLKGIWFSKYQPSSVETIDIDYTEPGVPDLSNFNSNDTKLIYYTSDGKEYVERDYSLNPSQTVEENSKTYYFYNYTNKIWANVKTTANGLESWWVWIPRFAYKLESGTSKVILIDKDDKPIDTETYGDSLPSGYKVHEAFKQKDGLNGIWFSKYQPSAQETGDTSRTEASLPNLSNFNSNDTKLIYYTSDGKEYVERDYSLNPSQTVEENSKTYYFYNYTNKIWANVKTTANGLESWWVWIPRFAYKVESGTTNVILIDANNKPLDTSKYGNTLPSGYKVHEAFTQDNGLMGIWFSKYQPSKN